MINLILAAIIAASCTQGTLSQYSAAATERVIANRSVPGRTAYTLPSNWREYDVLLAVQDCDDLGNEYDVYWNDHHGRALAFDCSGDAPTSAWMRRNRIIGEVSYNIARDWGMVGRGMRGAVVCREFAY